MTEIDWSDVRPRLAALAGGAEVVGDGLHRPLEPPLTGDELAELETQIGVALPEDYRAFLRQAGRGGAGPCYGLFPPRRVAGRWTWEGSPTRPETLARPFARIRGFVPDDYRRERPLHEGIPDLWGEVPADLPEDAVHSDGLLYLCDMGCAAWVTLVVSGPSRGQIWTDFCADGEGFQPEQNADGSRMTFTDWYRGWLRM
ncbi:SMI1/KNR4 family protein [Actinoplanes subglobosus]|uniref:SMI1/KNR4 family protein n=1 Tax=Actinoplanes subglobosus TaxID=1547892 RepID=A0ABV8IPR2_9ACTN